MVTRKDFERIAEIIRSNSKGNSDGPILIKKHFVQDLIDYFSEENISFDPDKFRLACSDNNISFTLRIDDEVEF